MDRENTPKSIRKSLNLLLPHHIIEEEILSRLPVQSLFRFRCVSKSWCSLIDSKPFIKTHLLNSSRNTAFPYHRLIINRDYGLRVKQCSPQSRVNQYSLQSILDGSINSTPIDDPNINQFEYIKIVGCFNGLVCILKEIWSFFFWNPSTRNFKELPQAHEASSGWHIFNRGFGWDESSDDYMVFAVVYIYSAKKVIGKVYSSKTNSWKTVEHMRYLEKKGNSFETVELVDLPLIYEEGMFVGGKLHWNRCSDQEGMFVDGELQWNEYEGERNIVCFDLKTEVWGYIELPYKYNAGSDFYSKLGVIGGYLSSVKFYSESPSEVWVMKEYGVKESWSKLIALSHVQELVQRPLSATYAVDGRDGVLFLFFGRFFLVYYPLHNEFRSLRQFGDFVYQEIICVESLVWPQVP